MKKLCLHRSYGIIKQLRQAVDQKQMEQRHLTEALLELRTASSDVYGCMRRDAGVWYMNEFSGIDAKKALEQLGVALKKSRTILDSVPPPPVPTLTEVNKSTHVPSVWDRVRYAIDAGISTSIDANDPHTYQDLKSLRLLISRYEQKDKKE